MTPPFESLLWPASRLGDAVAALSSVAQAPKNPDSKIAQNAEAIADWLEAAARQVGCEAQPVETPYADFDRQAAKMGPALLAVPSGGDVSFLAIDRPSRRSNQVPVLTPNGTKHRVAAETIRAALCSEMEKPVAEEIDALLERADVPAADQAKARGAILRERLGARRIRGIWILRLPPSASFWLQLRQVRVPARMLALADAHALQYLLWILAWWVVGANVMSGRPGSEWLALWALLLLTLVPLRVFITWLQGLVAVGAGARLKQRLFFGALHLDPDSIRHQGAGQLLGRVIECEAVEALALSGGFLALVAAIELLAAIFVLGAGAGGYLQSLVLAIWIAVAAAIAWRYFERNRTWTDVRLTMTHDLVESMVGHRTRLAQLPPDRWHDGEDEALERYLAASRAMDNSTAALLAIVPRGWLVLGLLGLAPAFVNGTQSSARIAVAVGGMLLAYRALRRLAAGTWQVAGAAVAWQRSAVLYRAAASSDTRPQPVFTEAHQQQPVVEAHDLMFRYNDRSEAVLRGCTLEISPGERLVLEGPSGGGKSTLVSLLIGLREPNSGRLRIGGIEGAMLGSRDWRRRVAAAPQFHENHVLAETLAFNLLMGKQRAPLEKDFQDAEAICHELGLGELLARMPAGMLQIVGETGWQLSHGERSRLYIARALLQDAELVVLDESFAALDPENLRRALECVVRRARSLLVIAHR